MPTNKQQTPPGVEPIGPLPDYVPDYPKPKILLLDLPPAAATELENLNLNVRWGTLSFKYKVPRKSACVPLTFSLHAPNYAEQEIIVVDLDPPVASAPPARAETKTRLPGPAG